MAKSLPICRLVQLKHYLINIAVLTTHLASVYTYIGRATVLMEFPPFHFFQDQDVGSELLNHCEYDLSPQKHFGAIILDYLVVACPKSFCTQKH